jgi:hypothetical protein
VQIDTFPGEVRKRRQVALDDVPDDVEAHAQVTVDDPVPEVGDILPRNVGVSGLEFGRQVLG